MSIIGVICEYNPFHNGHIYHLKKVKESFPNSLIILVMSGNFTQRGIPSIMDKWKKTEIALEYGVDLVVELPFVFATQSADIFAHGAISILKEMKAEYLVFGSETNDIDYLTHLANISLYNQNYQKKIKFYLDKGYNYPTALNMAFEGQVNIKEPNDLLAISYIKEILKQDAKITPVSIQRTNSFHEEEINQAISSATSIRLALKTEQDFSKAVPDIVYLQLKKEFADQDNYFPFLKYKIVSQNNLSIYQTVDEGIENRIKKVILETNNWKELVYKIKSKRYTYNKVNRMLIHILCDFTKEEANRMKDIEYIRILGFTQTGRNYLNRIKKDMNIPIISNYSGIDSEMLKIEMRATCIYSLFLPIERQNSFIKREYQNKPKIKD